MLKKLSNLRMGTRFQDFYLYGVGMGAGVTAVSIVPYSSIIAHWFEKKRGLASGIAVSGMGLGTFFWYRYLNSAFRGGVGG